MIECFLIDLIPCVGHTVVPLNWLLLQCPSVTIWVKMGYHVYSWSARQCRMLMGYAKLVIHQMGILTDYYFSISTRYPTS